MSIIRRLRYWRMPLQLGGNWLHVLRYLLFNHTGKIKYRGNPAWDARGHIPPPIDDPLYAVGTVLQPLPKPELGE